MRQAHARLERSEERWRSVFENSAIGVALGDLNGRFIATNPVLQKMLGYTEEELQNLTFLDITLEEFRDRNWSLVGDLLQDKVQQFQIEKQYRRKDGSLVWVHNNVSMVPGTERVPQFLMALSEDITERKRAEMALHAAMEERARLATFREEISVGLSRQEDLKEILHGCASAVVRHLDAAFVRIWTLSSDGRELQLQASAGKYTRLDGSHSRIAVGQLKIGLIAQERKPHFTNDVQNDPRVSDKDWARREKMISFAGYPLVLEDRLVGVMGMFSQKPLESALDALSFAAGVVAQGIERKRAEQSLNLQANILQNMPSVAWTVLPDGTPDFANQQWLDYTGQTLDYIRSSPEAWMNAVHPADREPATAAYWEGIRSGRGFTMETRFRRISDGECRWHLNRATPLRDSAGNLIKFVGTSTDISEKKHAEEALRASERDFRLIVDTIPGMVCTLKADWEVEFVNQPLREYFGKTLEELKDWEFIGVVHPDDIERVVAKTRHSTATGEPYEVEHRCLRHDGVFRWFQVRAMPLRDAAGYLVRWYLLLTDIEDRKQAEQQLRRNEWNLLEAQRLGHSGSWSLDVSSGTVTTTPEIFRAYDVRPGEDTLSPDFLVQQDSP